MKVVKWVPEIVQKQMLKRDKDADLECQQMPMMMINDDH